MKRKDILNSRKVVVSSSDDYFDDCPICRLMKKAESEGVSPTEKELEEAFTKANTQN